MKRTIIILLIAACVGITVYLNLVKEPLDPAIKSSVEAAVMAEPEFSVRPVWWSDDTLLAVGMLKTRSQHTKEAEKVCGIVKAHGLQKLRVEIYDVEKIQTEDKWELIGKADCGLLK